MSNQRIAHGATLEVATPQEIAELFAKTLAQQKPEEYRRYKGAIQLDASGNGFTRPPDILVPSQYDLTLDRVTFGGNGALGAIVAMYENQVNDVDLLEIVAISSVGATGIGGAPAGSTPIAASSTNANTAVIANLPGTAGAMTYITGFQVTSGGATAGSIVQVTVSPLDGATMNYSFAVPTGVTNSATPLIVTFPEPIPAGTAGVSIQVTMPAAGAGNTNQSVAAQGFQLPVGAGTVGKYSDSFSNNIFVGANSAVILNATGGVANGQITYNLQGRLIEKSR